MASITSATSTSSVASAQAEARAHTVAPRRRASGAEPPRDGRRRAIDAPDPCGALVDRGAREAGGAPPRGRPPAHERGLGEGLVPAATGAIEPRHGRGDAVEVLLDVVEHVGQHRVDAPEVGAPAGERGRLRADRGDPEVEQDVGRHPHQQVLEHEVVRLRGAREGVGPRGRRRCPVPVRDVRLEVAHREHDVEAFDPVRVVETPRVVGVAHPQGGAAVQRGEVGRGDRRARGRRRRSTSARRPRRRWCGPRSGVRWGHGTRTRCAEAGRRTPLVACGRGVGVDASSASGTGRGRWARGGVVAPGREAGDRVQREQRAVRRQFREPAAEGGLPDVRAPARGPRDPRR
jgi:hypothetical protein